MTPVMDAYRDYSAGEQYDVVRYSGAMGRFRLWQQRRAVAWAVERISPGSSILDCPCGTGRIWWQLQRRGLLVTGTDVSPGMIRHARERSEQHGGSVAVVEADATSLPFADASFDWVFSFALTKHLDPPTQYRVLAEFGRVARVGVICTFGLLNHVTYELWRRRHAEWVASGTAESIPLWREELEWMGNAAGLWLHESRRCTTPVGVEHLCVLRSRR